MEILGAHGKKAHVSIPFPLFTMIFTKQCIKSVKF